MSEEIAEVIITFLRETGIDVEETTLDGETFLPGILVEGGKLLVDRSKLKFPGDLLHEAGHLAVVPAGKRSNLSDKVELDDAAMDPIEAQAIAWLYAAALHLEIDPRVVFHEGGYGGQAEALMTNFDLGVYLGVNGLEEAGLALTEKSALVLNANPYPKMRKWLRD